MSMWDMQVWIWDRLTSRQTDTETNTPTTTYTQADRHRNTHTHVHTHVSTHPGWFSFPSRPAGPWRSDTTSWHTAGPAPRLPHSDTEPGLLPGLRVSTSASLHILSTSPWWHTVRRAFYPRTHTTGQSGPPRGVQNRPLPPPWFPGEKLGSRVCFVSHTINNM